MPGGPVPKQGKAARCHRTVAAAELEALQQAGAPVILYDGGCPFCRRYVAAVQAKALGSLCLNLRENHGLVAALQAKGLEPNTGMVVADKGVLHHGPDATRVLAERIVAHQGRCGVLHKWLAHPAAGPPLYRALTAGRRLWLRLSGNTEGLPSNSADRRR